MNKNIESQLSSTQWVDEYFLKTKAIVLSHGDAQVTYAIFMRRPVLSAPRIAINWLKQKEAERKTKYQVDLCYPEGSWVGAGEPLLYISGLFSELVDLETELLMKIGSACVAAYNAFNMCSALPHVPFLAMDARHCAGHDMAELMSYAASVGSASAKVKAKASGFIGNSIAATAHYFDNEKAMGTMPHALIGYAGSTLKAAQLYAETFPDQNLVVLIDYFAQEITDSLEVCAHFSEAAKAGNLSLRIDTSGGRYVEGLDPTKSYAVLEKHAPRAIRGFRTEDELKHLVGTGVSAAAIFWLRENLDKNGFEKVKIIASSGFDENKCLLMAEAKAPIDMIGTGSFLPEKWRETYATADIIGYDGIPRVKVGREFLFRK